MASVEVRDTRVQRSAWPAQRVRRRMRIMRNVRLREWVGMGLRFERGWFLCIVVVAWCGSVWEDLRLIFVYILLIHIGLA